MPHDQPISAPVGGNIRGAIDYAFPPGFGIDEILNALEGSATGANEPEVREFAKKTKETILSRSPTSVRVAIEQLSRGTKWSIAETFRREHAIAGKFMEHPDFVEGVSSLLIRKPRTTPQWQPSDLSKVTQADVKAFFDAKPDLELLSTEDYREYPHAWIGLPSEKAVEAFVSNKGAVGRAEVVEHFVNMSNGKLGVEEKVEEILSRKTDEQADGRLSWKRAAA